jgi:tryptophan-rich sensory protein
MTTAPITSANPGWPPFKAATVAFLAVAVAAAIGSLATTPNIPTWYAGIAKPSFNPPNWVFAPVWSALYLMMAYAFYRILRLPASPARRSAIIAFSGQMALNALWSVAFFALRSPALAFLVIVSLWTLIALTMTRFLALDRLAGWLLAPYLAWVSFAALLNAAVWRLN